MTTTCSPVTSRAAWTWAIDAAASGTGSNEENSSPDGRAEVLLDDAAHDGEGLGRHLVAAQAELGHELLGEEPLARGEDLARA